MRGFFAFWVILKSVVALLAVFCDTIEVMKKQLKGLSWEVEDQYGVCLWLMPDGGFLGDDDGRYLSLHGVLNSPITEDKMRRSALHYFGDVVLQGEPFWMPGSRKVTDNEFDDQMERLLDGYIPDPVDSVKQLQRRGIE